MRWRLFLTILSVCALAVIGFGIPLALAVQNQYRDEALLKLSEAAAQSAVAVPGSFASQSDTPELPIFESDVDIALYDIHGRRVVGVGPELADSPVTDTLRTGTAQRIRNDLIVTFPISDQEFVVGAIRASSPNSAVTAKTLKTWALMSAWSLLILAVAGVVAARRSHSLVLPLGQLRADADVIGDGGELPFREPSGIIEIDTVRNALAAAAARLNKALARERSFGSDLAHQLRTPLASMRLRLETEQLLDTANTKLIEDSLVDVDRLQQTIDDLLNLARDTQDGREAHAIATLLRDAADRWQPKAAANGRLLKLVMEDQLAWAQVRSAAIRQILDVLIDNALNHGQGDVTITGRQIGNGIVLGVADQGQVILDSNTIFTRRHSAAIGTGIGLALAHRLAEADDMRLVLANPGPGVVFHLVIGGRAF
ncbi:MAG: HAMP domain-containing sensor histidine kinase [Ilumatobacteraceae bacterium]